jgi:hypothetical protein
MKTIHTQMSAKRVSSLCVIPDRMSSGVRALRNNQDCKKEIPDLNIRFTDEEKNQDRKQEEKHAECTEFGSQGSEFRQEDLEEKKELPLRSQTVPEEEGR